MKLTNQQTTQSLNSVCSCHKRVTLVGLCMLLSVTFSGCASAPSTYKGASGETTASHLGQAVGGFLGQFFGVALSRGPDIYIEKQRQKHEKRMKRLEYEYEIAKLQTQQ